MGQRQFFGSVPLFWRFWWGRLLWNVAYQLALRFAWLPFPHPILATRRFVLDFVYRRWQWRMVVMPKRRGLLDLLRTRRRIWRYAFSECLDFVHLFCDLPFFLDVAVHERIRFWAGQALPDFVVFLRFRFRRMAVFVLSLK